jgi:hypothetical protein
VCFSPSWTFSVRGSRFMSDASISLVYTAAGVGVAICLSFVHFFLLGIVTGSSLSGSSMSGARPLILFFPGVLDGVAVVVTSHVVLYVCSEGPISY